jgi:hypothetical protein
MVTASTYTDLMKSALSLVILVATQLSAFGQESASTPSDCAKKDLLTNGNPAMTPIRKDLAIGLSLAKYEFKAGDQIKLHIWVDNSGDAPAEVWTCSDLDHFKDWGFDLFGRAGRRILNRDVLQLQKKLSTDPSVKWKPSPCKREFQISIPAHTCVTSDDYDFATELTSRYDLPPDKYILRVRANWRNTDGFFKPPGNEPFHAMPADVTFKVTKP